MQDINDKWNNASLDSETDEDEVDDELALPMILAHYDLIEKRKLLHYKKNHSEREWETELLRREDLIQKQHDLERLKQMFNKSQAVEQNAKKRLKVKVPNEVVNDDEKLSEGEEESSDDDLFNDDEVEAFSSKFISDKNETRIEPKGESVDEKIGNKRLRRNNERSYDEEDSDDIKQEEEDDDEVDGEEGIFSDDDDDGDEEPIEEDKSDIDEPVAASYQDCLKLQLRRSQIESLVNEPFFERAVLRSFVRLSVGVSNDVAVYLMAEIVGVKDSYKPYKLDNCKQTQMRLDLAVGNSIKRFRISLVSNSRISQSEFDDYITRLKSRGLQPISQNVLTQRRKTLKELAHNHQYTHNEIDSMISKKMGLNKAVTTNNSSALENLKKKLEKALSSKDWENVDAIKKEMEKIEEVMKNEKSLVDKTAMVQVSLNKRNKENNSKRDVQAGLKKLLQGDKSKQSEINDPFVRRETRPTNLWKSGQKLESEKKKEDLKKKLDQLKSEGFGESEEAKNIEIVLNEFSATTVKQQLDINSKKSTSNYQDEWQQGRISIDEIRVRAKERFGVDPLSLAEENSRYRYLKSICANLPPKGTSQRELVRQGITVNEYKEMLDKSI